MFSRFSARSSEAELMDDPTIVYEDFSACLHDLEIVNQLTLAYRPVKQWLFKALERTSSGQSPTIIDVGSGGGDTLRFIARKLLKLGRRARLIGVDLNPWSARYSKTHTPDSLLIDYETADIFDYGRDQTYDFVISSLFTHHLNKEQLIAFLRWMDHHTVVGWFINDLHRHPIAYYGFKWLSKAFRFHFMVQHDGPISVGRAFTRKDWASFLTKAGITESEVEIEWHFPFRYSLSRFKR